MSTSDNGVSMTRFYDILSRHWPSLVSFALVGAVIFWVYALAGGLEYEASASAEVHHNALRARPRANEREIASYLNQETAFLETLAYSDAVWDAVREQMASEGWLRGADDGQGLIDLVRVPHPMDGEWRFSAASRDPALAARLANVWARVFVDVVNRGVATSQERDALALRIQGQNAAYLNQRETCVQLETSAAEVQAVIARLEVLPSSAVADPNSSQRLARLANRAGVECSLASGCEAPATIVDQLAFAQALGEALQELRANCETESQLLREELDGTIAEAANQSSGSLDISPWLEVGLMREAVPPSAPRVPSVWYLLAGAGVGMAVWLARLWRRSSQRPEAGNVA